MKKSESMRWSATLSAAALACVAVLPGVAFAGSMLTFKLQNASDYELTGLYVSPSLEDNWGEDVLGANALAAGAAADVSVVGRGKTCLYDIRFVAADGSLMEEVGVDLCTLDSYTLDP
jgi:hypothetical protein